jgi:hypothetical protein
MIDGNIVDIVSSPKFADVAPLESPGLALVDSTNYDTATALAANAGIVALPASGGPSLEALAADNARLRAWNGQLLAERRAPPQAERPTAGVTANGGGTRHG